jgi:hypothetical protein
MNLYEINSEYSRIMAEAIELAEQNEGEISEELSKALEGVEMALEEKIENTALYIKNLEAEAEMIKVEEKRLSERRKACENKAERVREWLSFNLDGKPFKTGRCAISWRKSESVEVMISPETLPVEYQNIKTTVAADKTALKSAIKSGVEIVGVSLVEKQNMQVK